MKQLLSTIAFVLYALASHAQVILVDDILPGTYSTVPLTKTVFGNKLVFYGNTTNAGWRLYYYDDTAVHMVGSQGDHLNHSMAVADNKLYFRAFEPSIGNELFVWDGTNTPTIVNDINNGAAHSTPNFIIAHNNKIYFQALSAAPGFELWMHDPAGNITRRLNQGTAYIGAAYLTVFNNKIYFRAADSATSLRSRLFVYDPVTDVVQHAPNFDPYTTGYDLANLTVCYGKLYYTATTTQHGYELYAYDGNSAPIRITDIFTGSINSMPWGSYASLPAPGNIVPFNGAVYFIAQDGTTSIAAPIKLYKYDPLIGPKEGNPSLVSDIDVEGVNRIVPELIAFDDKLYFTGCDSIHGEELWMYDGINNPSMITDINTGPIVMGDYPGNGMPQRFCVYKNSLYFTASSHTAGIELFKLGYGAAVSNINRVTDIQVYPIPAADIVHFEMLLKHDFNFIITLADLSGREVYNSGKQSSSNGKSIVSANISQLTKGNYFYRVASTDGITIASGKVMKQ